MNNSIDTLDTVARSDWNQRKQIGFRPLSRYVGTIKVSKTASPEMIGAIHHSKATPRLILTR